jgi:hypothetical protein
MVGNYLYTKRFLDFGERAAFLHTLHRLRDHTARERCTLNKAREAQWETQQVFLVAKSAFQVVIDLSLGDFL